jgi:hypothetical protein
MRRVDSAALAKLTPVALNLAPPTPFIDWGDLGDVRFGDPFFDQTVERWAGLKPPPRLTRTELAALAGFADARERDPLGLIFHMSRCGSTLLSRLLGTVPDTLMLSEPQPLNALLAGTSPMANEVLLAQALRCLVRALGQRRFGEKTYLLKLSSWNVRRLRLFQLAFPAAKIVFVQRAPIEVMASMNGDPPGWLQLQNDPAAADMLFGIKPDALAGLDAKTFGAQALAAMLAAACEAAQAGALVVDYSELPSAAWTRVAPFLGMPVAAPDLRRMQDEARYDAKHAGRRIFAGEMPERDLRDAMLHGLAAEVVEPAYRELDRLRHMQLAASAAAPADQRQLAAAGA